MFHSVSWVSCGPLGEYEEAFRIIIPQRQLRFSRAPMGEYEKAFLTPQRQLRFSCGPLRKYEKALRILQL